MQVITHCFFRIYQLSHNHVMHDFFFLLLLSRLKPLSLSSLILKMRQNASGGQVRPSLPNGPTTNSLPSPNPSLQPPRPHLGPHRAPCPPQPLANGPVGAGSHGHSEPLPVGNNSSSNNNQSSPAATGPNGDVPYLQPAGSGDAALLPHTCTSTTTQDATPHQALHLNSSQVRESLFFTVPTPCLLHPGCSGYH